MAKNNGCLKLFDGVGKCLKKCSERYAFLTLGYFMIALTVFNYILITVHPDLVLNEAVIAFLAMCFLIGFSMASLSMQAILSKESTDRIVKALRESKKGRNKRKKK